MKYLIFFCFLICFNASFAQDVSGLYTGTLYNDSTRMTQQYQLALSDYRGKITGYSYTTYVVNDTFYYGIRRIRATKENGKLIVNDDKFIINNFPESPSKGVKRTSILPLNGQDSIIDLSGRWQTNRTKQYYSVSGPVQLKRDTDSSQSALIGHLRELGLIAEFNQVAEVKIKTKDKGQKVKIKPVAENPSPQKIVSLAPQDRKNKLLQAYDLTSDSLVLSFYDNGVVDGDIISVYINDQQIISSAKLTEKALKKTVKVSANESLIEVKLVADNLGSLPPNTGLLVLEDGNKKYHINFSADLMTNVSIVFRKSK